MVKFTSWFKERSFKSSGSDKEKPGLPPDNHDQEESTQESQPQTITMKGKQLLSRLGNGKPLYRKYWFWVGFLGLAGGIVGISYTGYTVWSIDRSLPNKLELNTVVREKTLTIKAANGIILQQTGPVTGEPLKLNQIPEKLRKAFIASEDSRFDKHNGVDPQGIIRAFFNNLRSKDVVEGGSTITQQLARILFLTQERTVWRKLKEVRLAQKMERELSKDQILEHYLNLVYLGSGAYGVGDAAHIYFSKSVNELTLGEIATIAGLAPAPSRYSPEVNPEAAKQRRNTVLQRMQEVGFITPAEQQAAMAEQIALKHSSPKQLDIQSPYFTTYIQKELPKYVSPDVLAEGGLTVETTLNPTWQKTAEESVAKTLRNQGRWENFKQGSMVAIDPRSGEIEAMVGGKNFGKNQFNRVTQAQRQPGSTFKGFVYATAIASGISPYREYEDAPFVVDGYEPKNFSEKFHGSMSIRDALTKSVNIIAVKVLISVGFNPTIKLAHDMGIKSDLKPTYSLALGSNEVNLLELTSAYGSFATNGLHVESHGIKRILNRWGKVIWSANFQQTRALDAESSAIMTWMLRNVVQEGTGAAAQLDNRPVAGKTGTSDEARDLWFIGYIPQLVTGVWLGNDNNNPTDGSSGSAASTWHQFMETAVKGMPVQKFPSIPKLEGRKGTIKAEPVKPKRIMNRPISATEKSDNSSKSDDGDRWQRRHRSSDSSDQQQQQEETSRSRRRHYSEQQNEENSTSRRRYRRERSEESSSTTSNGESSRSRRRSKREDSDSTPRASTSHQQSESTSHSPSSNSPSQPSSWRERLKPSSSGTNSGT